MDHTTLTSTLVCDFPWTEFERLALDSLAGMRERLHCTNGPLYARVSPDGRPPSKCLTARQCTPNSGHRQRRSSKKDLATGKDTLWRTEICAHWANGRCAYAQQCRFAHGVHELRARHRPRLYKTQLCKKFLDTGGYCPYGDRCDFIHAFIMFRHETNERVPSVGD